MNANHIRADDASTAGRPDTARRGHTRPSIRACVTARLRAARFDRALAVGVPAPAGSALAGHAARLSPGAERQAVARALRRAVRDATDDTRANIASAQALIDAQRPTYEPLGLASDELFAISAHPHGAGLGQSSSAPDKIEASGRAGRLKPRAIPPVCTCPNDTTRRDRCPAVTSEIRVSSQHQGSSHHSG
jgi:hypothetical protein